MNLTEALHGVATALTGDSTIDSICQDTWGRSLTVYRRVGELYVPQVEETPLVQMMSRGRARDGHHVHHSVTIASFAGQNAEPQRDSQVVYSSDEEASERLAERVEEVAMQSFATQGVAAEASKEAEDIITGPYFIAAYTFQIVLRNVIK